jgi:hypothetical protein
VVLCVEEEDAKVLLFQQAHLGHEQVGRVGGGTNLWGMVALHRQPGTEFQGGFDAGRGGSPDAGLLLEFSTGGTSHTDQVFKSGQQRSSILKLVGVAQEDGQQLGGAEGVGAVVVQAVDGALALRELLDGERLAFGFLIRLRRGAIDIVGRVFLPEGQLLFHFTLL